EGAAVPSVEAARANVQAAVTPEASAAPNSVAAAPGAEVPAVPAAVRQPEQSQPQPPARPGNRLMRELSAFWHDVKGLRYKGAHAAPKKSNENEPRSN